MKAKAYMDQGGLVPDQLTIGMLKYRIQKDDCKNGYVLDGFPRTIPQAESLTKALSERGEAVDYAVNVDVPDENIDIYSEIQNIIQIDNQIDIEH